MTILMGIFQFEFNDHNWKISTKVECLKKMTILLSLSPQIPFYGGLIWKKPESNIKKRFVVHKRTLDRA